MNNKNQHPDAKLHMIASFIKSGIRVLGFSLMLNHMDWAIFTLVMAEIIGVAEEMV